MLRTVTGQRPNVSVLDFNAKLNPDGKYTAKINGVRMRSDGVHPTSEAVQWLAPWLLDSLRAAREACGPIGQCPRRPRPSCSSRMARSLPSGPSTL